MAANLLDRVTKLIALASSNQLEESRTAAALACKLIREQGFKVVAGSDTDTGTRGSDWWREKYGPSGPPSPEQEPFSHEWWRAPPRRASGSPPPPPPREPPPPKPKPAPAPPPPAPTPAPAVPRKTIRARYGGWCAKCHERFEPGDGIAWARGAPTTHAECRAAKGSP